MKVGPWFLLIFRPRSPAAWCTWARDKPSTDYVFLSDWQLACKGPSAGAGVVRGRVCVLFCFSWWLSKVFSTIRLIISALKEWRYPVECELGSVACWAGGWSRVAWPWFTIRMWALASGAPRRDTYTPAPWQGGGRGASRQDPPQLGRPAFSFQMGYSIFFLIRSHTFFKKCLRSECDF